MGYTTDFIGHIEIDPPLNDEEQLYLSTFSKTRRYNRRGGPYEVPANPSADPNGEAGDGIERTNEVAVGQPGYWCQWVPCWEGCCLAYDGGEKFYNSTRWMSYLIDHFLKPGALASESGLGWFKEFTFDHQANGIIAACRRDNRELYLLRVEDNKVGEEVLRPADPDPYLKELLAYEAEADRWAERRARRRRARADPGANIVPFAR